MNTIPAPDAPAIGKSCRWFTWRKISIFLLLLLGFLSYVAYGAKESWRVAAAHTGVGLISGQLQLFASRQQEPLTLEAAVRLLKADRWDVATDGSGRYNLSQIGDRFVIYTEVLRQGFALNRVVVFGSQEKDGTSKNGGALPEVEFIARKKAREF